MLTGAAQWLATALFVVLSVHYGWRLVGSRSAADVVANGCHLVMSVLMALMWWPVWLAIPVAPQAVFFGLLGLVFAGQSVLGRGQHGQHGRAGSVSHAFMCVAMVWMIVVMAGGDAAGEHAHHAELGVATAVTGVVATAGLLVVGVLHAVDAIVVRQRHEPLIKALEPAAMAAMGLGMAWMCWLMVAT